MYLLAFHTNNYIAKFYSGSVSLCNLIHSFFLFKAGPNSKLYSIFFMRNCQGKTDKCFMMHLQAKCFMMHMRQNAGWQI